MPPGAHLTPNIDHDPLRCLTTTELASGLSPGARTIPAAVLPYLRSRVTMSRLSQQPSVRGRIANLAGSTPCARSRVSLEASRRGVRSTAVRAQEQVVEFFVSAWLTALEALVSLPCSTISSAFCVPTAKPLAA